MIVARDKSFVDAGSPANIFATFFQEYPRRAPHQTAFRLAFAALVAKTLRRNNCGGGLSMKTQIPNIDVVRSAWRRVKKDIKDAIIRDLKPVKDVKGGGGFEGKSRSTKGGTGTTGSH